MTKIATGLFAAAAVAALSAAPAHALVLQGDLELTGTGLGSVHTVLTLQSPGRSSDESGAVTFGAGSGTVTGDAMTGAAQSRLRSLADIGVTSADDLRLVFNASEPQSPGGRSIQLQDLRLSIYSPTGELLFQSGAFNPVNFSDTFAGAGKAGALFALDAAETAQAQTAAFGPGSGGNLIGLSASATDATGGVETFFVASSAAITPIPEPASALLMLAGLAALAGGWRLGKRPTA